MATRIKTVEFTVQTEDATLAAATKRTQSGTIYLPESSIVFRSVVVEHTFNEDITSGTSATSVAMGIKLGAAAETTTTVTDTVTTSAEVVAYRCSNDVTAYFTTNWSGTSMTFEANTTVGVNVSANHAIKIRITYEYDDASATHIKTIWIPIESTLSLLTTSYVASGGSGAIPALKGGSSVLPEDSVVIRQVWIELFGAEATSSNTDWVIDANLATDAFEQLSLARYEAALISLNCAHVIWDVTAADLDTTQDLELKTTGVTSRLAWPGGWIAVTYEYDPAASTEIWNSVLVPATDPVDQKGFAATDASVSAVELMIEEPTTITTKPSAVFFHSNGSQGSGQAFLVKAGPQAAFKSFTDTFLAGPAFVALRCDAGGQGGGAGIGLARGRNRFAVKSYAGLWWYSTGGFAILNYTSGKAAAGVGAHNQTRHFAIAYYAADSGFPTWSANKTPAIPETAYYLQGVAVRCAVLTSNLQITGVSILTEYASGEGPLNGGEGWVPAIAGPVMHGSAENFQLEQWGQIPRSVLKRWAGDPNTERMNIETARTWRYNNPDAPWVHACGMFVTYHAITFEFAGEAVNYAGDGSGISVRLVRDSDGERLLTTTTAVGGGYSLDWYDDTENVFVEMRESATKVGRSERGLAS